MKGIMTVALVAFGYFLAVSAALADRYSDPFPFLPATFTRSEPLQWSNTTSQRSFKTASRSVVVVEGERKHGMGVVIGRTEVVAACHVLAVQGNPYVLSGNSGDTIVETIDGRSHIVGPLTRGDNVVYDIRPRIRRIQRDGKLSPDALGARLVERNEDYDLCLLLAPGLLNHPVLRPVASGPLRTAAPILISSAGTGDALASVVRTWACEEPGNRPPYTLHPHNEMACRGDGESLIDVRTAVKVPPGTSGGGIFQNGRLVGIVVGGYFPGTHRTLKGVHASEQITVAVPVIRVEQLLKTYDRDYALRKAVKETALSGDHDLALALAREIGEVGRRVNAMHYIGEAQAKFGKIDAARRSFRTAVTIIHNSDFSQRRSRTRKDDWYRLTAMRQARSGLYLDAVATAARMADTKRGVKTVRRIANIAKRQPGPGI